MNALRGTDRIRVEAGISTLQYVVLEREDVPTLLESLGVALANLSQRDRSELEESGPMIELRNRLNNTDVPTRVSTRDGFSALHGALISISVNSVFNRAAVEIIGRTLAGITVPVEHLDEIITLKQALLETCRVVKFKRGAPGAAWIDEAMQNLVRQEVAERSPAVSAADTIMIRARRHFRLQHQNPRKPETQGLGHR